MKHWSRNKFCYYPAGSCFAFETKFINKKLSNEFGFKVYLGLSRCMKGGHTHNHVKNAHKRMKKCNICGKPITKYEGFSSRFTGHICMECYIEECREHAVMAGIPTIGSLFDDLRNPYIKWK